ncbi:hypothetical protein OCU04_002871 [Sclerotinia nivalis]|uniref:Uncharacterized protein n=1 Tax=Sclerotinia nivalis TaxID=352851 RepID=A0A9X0AVI7_9HELO|nr:hypothetical protein OCU04_002871 [Sclerotinia nivalis]
MPCGIHNPSNLTLKTFQLSPHFFLKQHLGGRGNFDVHSSPILDVLSCHLLHAKNLTSLTCTFRDSSWLATKKIIHPTHPTFLRFLRHFLAAKPKPLTVKTNPNFVFLTPLFKLRTLTIKTVPGGPYISSQDETTLENSNRTHKNVEIVNKMLGHSGEPMWTREIPGWERGISEEWGTDWFKLVWDAGLGRRLMVRGGQAESMSVEG